MLPLGWMGETAYIKKKNTKVSGLLRKAIYRNNGDIKNIIFMHFWDPIDYSTVQIFLKLFHDIYEIHIFWLCLKHDRYMLNI